MSARPANLHPRAPLPLLLLLLLLLLLVDLLLSARYPEFPPEARAAALRN